MTNYEALANAIAEQAAKDFRKSAKSLKQANARLAADPDDKKARKKKRQALRMLADVSEYFKSNRFRRMFNMDGGLILERLRKECDL